jgi:AraC family transcriptional regulator of adaptative response/methylated-DNA-[protein]-cysteine methyltransferase
MTFAAWCRARRLGQAFTRLREGARIDEVVFDHGFESHSGFREAFSQAFGLPPGRAAASDCLYSALFQTPLGPMVAAATGRAVCFLEFADRRMFQEQVRILARRFKLPLVPGENALLTQLKIELQAYFEGRLRAFTVPVQKPGTPFQERVWSELTRIPYGETISYDMLAARAGSPGAQRAAGTANGMNRLAILVPCHRVVGKDGQLSGYGGGLWRKRLLLELERTGTLGEASAKE